MQKELPARAFRLKPIIIFLSALGLQMAASSALADCPRLFVWGLDGTEAIGRVDALIPFSNNECNRIWYGDIQGEVGGDSAWYTGAGAGYRGLACQRIYGAYLFLDRNESRHNNNFYVLNPGIETIGYCWDARFNAYIPVSDDKRGPSFFRASDNCSGNCGCSDFVFRGHQQFAPRFHELEEVGPGADAEIGFHVPRFQNFSIYAGGYFYHLNEELNEERNIKGVEARGVLPLNQALAVTVEASYDNVQHGAVVGGIRLQLGHVTNCPVTLCDHLYDPIVRNIATVKSGAGIPIVHGFKKEGLTLFRDNIYFFSSQRGVAFAGAGTGTFEDPLAANQFTQTTVDGIAAIAPNANLFFNTGTYLIQGTGPIPNSRILLPAGQSLYGRTLDYQCSAVGSERPVLLGGLDIFGGNNTLDSIIIRNSITDPAINTNLVAVNLLNAQNVFILNSEFDAILNMTGNNARILGATGLAANNSGAFISNSSINGIINIAGNSIQAAAVGIGFIDSIFMNNFITITNSAIAGNVNIGGSSTSLALAGGIANLAHLGTFGNDFTGNNFIINGSMVSGNVAIGLDNTRFAIAMGIGNEGGLFGANNFVILNSNISTNLLIGRNNSFIATVAGVGNNLGDEFNDNNFQIINSDIAARLAVVGTTLIGFNTSAGIGDAGSFVTFADNTFTIIYTHVTAEASTGTLASAGINGVVGIGHALGNEITGNTYIINSSLIDAKAIATLNVDSFNRAVGLGDFGTPTIPGTENILSVNNFFAVQNSIFNVLANIVGDNTGAALNQAVGVNSFAFDANNNVYAINFSHFNIEAIVGGNNTGLNEATGLFAGPGSFMSVANSTFNILAIANGNNTADATDGDGAFSIENTIFHIFIT